MPDRSRIRRPHRALRAVAALLLAGLVTACSGAGAGAGDSGQAAAPDPLKSGPSVGVGEERVAQAVLDADLSVATGKIGTAYARDVAQDVAGVVDDWFVRAYLSGPWPRTDFSSAWRNFSRDLAAWAKQERSVTSNAALGARIDAVRAEQRVVRVDVLGVDSKAVGATARVRLVFVTDGDVRLRVTITGELNLLPSGDTWAVFGYDLQRTQEELATPTPSAPASPSQEGATP
ncbi:hypothetical protein [Nocardioides sp. AE5]|uniref:hypothetical protein n=1 Tax=Nocardioides sp. AE5 TaxID=2962573 RepID=UPI0028816082|nr:hypothetical protein [Nocardioides sp. AE5]MDT0200977.1 hypothetical protein [Nocardioides sp. AE5]